MDRDRPYDPCIANSNGMESSNASAAEDCHHSGVLVRRTVSSPKRTGSIVLGTNLLRYFEGLLSQA